jgi:hypothetical protein
VKSERTVKIKVEPGTEEVSPAKRHNDIFVLVKDLAKSIHSDQTGAFLYTLQQGNRYLMIAIHLDANSIFCEPMKNRSEDEMIEAYQKIINRMKAAGLGLKTHRLNNEASKAYKQCIHRNGMMDELVLPDNHRSNLAERAIQTFKHHFISILRGVDDKFPLSLWCVLLKQTELTVNLLRQSNVVPKKSAFTHVHGHHDYMKKLSRRLGARSKSTSSPKTDGRGTPTPKHDSTLGRHWSTTNASRYMTQKPEQQESATQYFSSTNILPTRRSHLRVWWWAVQQLTSALKGNIPAGNETAEALKKVSKLFTKIAEAKANVAKAKEQQNRIRTHPNAHRAIPLPRVVEQNPRVVLSIPRVDKAPKADCCVVQIVMNSTTPRFDVQSPVTYSQSRPPRVDAQSSATRSNYILQDKKEDEEPQWYNTCSQTMSIMQEAMLACVDISKPTYIAS